MMCNRSIELHPYEHITKMERRAQMLTPHMRWFGLPQIGVSDKEAIRKA